MKDVHSNPVQNTGNISPCRPNHEEADPRIITEYCLPVEHGFNNILDQCVDTDHVIINQKWRRSLQDVKANRGADIGSDHVLVVATMSLKLRKTKRGEKRQQRFDTAKLNNSNTEKAFKLELKNRFHVLQEEQEMNIDSFNQLLSKTSKSLLWYRKTERRMDKNRHMENDRRKKRNKEEDKRHQITADKGTTTDQIFDSRQGSKKKDESRQESIH